MRHAMHTTAAALISLGSLGAQAQPSLLASQGRNLYRYHGGIVTSFPLASSENISGMTTVPTGITVGTLNGGAGAGDIIALGSATVFRVDNPLSTPTLIPIGIRGGTNASPVFVAGRLFGIGGELPHGSVLTEWDHSFNQIGHWPTGVFGGPGGLVGKPGTTDEFYYAEFNNDAIYHYRLGDAFSTFVCSTPNNDYVGSPNASRSFTSTI